MVSEHLNIVILAGGAGTRLWPMSTKEKPKQFQRLVSEKTMLQETLDRVRFVDPSKIYVSTNAEYVHFVKAQLPEIDDDHIIAEPSMQDTGPCIGLAAALIAKNDPDAIMAVVYADHLVRDEAQFQEKIETAAQIAFDEDTLNIIEVEAKSPNVNLGYVKIGSKIKELNGSEVFEFEAFKEKPDLETAERFLSEGSYLWNTGYYVWRTDRILKEFKKYLPDTYTHLMAIQSGEPIEELYPKCDKISVDYGIMEKVDSSEVRIIPADFGWNDIGTWASLYKELAETEGANLTKGKVRLLDCTGCLVYNETENELSLMGLKDMAVVQTDSDCLVCPIEKSTDLKQLLAT